MVRVGMGVDEFIGGVILKLRAQIQPGSTGIDDQCFFRTLQDENAHAGIFDHPGIFISQLTLHRFRSPSFFHYSRKCVMI